MVVGLRLRIGFVTTVALVALALVPAAFARSANYVFAGGTQAERAQVTKALDASSFDWHVLPARVTVHIGRGLDSEATPGDVWLDAELLDSGRFAWGVIQHEFAHQVDFLLLTDAQRAQLARLLHVSVWCSLEQPGLRHADYGCERFASTLSWAYWQSSDNVMRPRSANDESAALAPAVFRSTLKRMLGPDFAPRETRR
jgi:hypothetical protein